MMRKARSGLATAGRRPKVAGHQRGGLATAGAVQSTQSTQDTSEVVRATSEEPDSTREVPPEAATTEPGPPGAAAEPDPPEAGEAARRPHLRRIGRALRRPRVLIPVVLICALLAGTGYLGAQVHQQAALESSRAGALRAAREYATDLSTYDHTRLDTNFRAVTANATGPFAEQYHQVSASLTELIKQNQAVSQGSVLSAGLAEASADRAVAILFVDQKITNTNNPQPRIDRNRMQMRLVHQGDRWLVDDIKLL